MSGFDALNEILLALLGQCIQQVYTGLVSCEDVQRSNDAHVRDGDGLSLHTFAVTGDTHVSHDIDIAHMLAEEPDGRVGGFGDPLHQSLLADIPLILKSCVGMDPAFSDPAVRAADADVLVGTAEAAHHMSLEMSQRQHTVIVQHALSDGHGIEPFSVSNRKLSSTLVVRDIHVAEVPSVDLQCFPVLGRGVAVARIVGVGLDDVCVRKSVFDQILYPGTRDDIRAVGLAGMKLYRDLSLQHTADLIVDLQKTGLREVSCEKDRRFRAGAFAVRNISVTTCTGDCFFDCHGGLLS